MLPIEKRLDDLFGAKVIAYSTEGKSAAFKDYLAQEQKHALFYELVLEHRMLTFENDVYRDHLIKNAHLYSAEELQIKVNTALKFAELLEIIYRDYLTTERIANRFRQEQVIYRNWLQSQDSYPRTSSQPAPNALLAKSIRTQSEQFNFWRLLFIRTRRLLLLLMPICKDYAHYSQIIQACEVVFAPIARHQGWIFFIPRLSTNLFLVAKHNVYGLMPKEEKDLPWLVRFRAQMDVERRWWEIANDTAWFSANFVNAFVLTGALSPFAFYVNLALPLHDTLLSSLRAYLEMNRLHKLKQHYLELSHDDETPCIDSLEERIDFEIAQMLQRIMVNALMFTSMSLAIPFIALNPIIPMLGGLLSVTTTIAARLISDARINPDSKAATAIQATLNAQQNPANGAVLFGLFAPERLDTCQSNERVGIKHLKVD